MEVLQIPHKQLQYEFQDILFNTKFAVAVDDALKKVNSLSISTSISMPSEEYRALGRVLGTEDVQSLRRIAEMPRSTDHFQDCIQMYITRRKDTVNMICGQLQKKMNVEAVRVFAYWEDLSEKIQRWIQIARICIGNIFAEEKCLYEQIFGGLGSVEDAQGYVHIIGHAAAKLFEFPDSLMSSRRLARKLDILLPLYEELLNLMPVVDGLFPKDLRLTGNIHDCASGLVCGLAQHMKRLLSASEHHVLRELSINPTPGGAIHPLTEYVIRYIDLIFNYRKSLSDHLIGTLEGSNDLTTPELDSLEIDQDQSIPLKHHLTRIIGFLLYNLRYKSKFYDHESLRHLFMMNNVHCVAQKIGNSQGLQEIIGYNYLMKLRNKVKEAMTDYLKTTWNGVLYCLRDERSKPQGKWSPPFGKSNRDVKEKLKTFNLMIKNVHERQEEWEVLDKQLRKKLHQSILDKLIPAYSNFLKQHSSQIDKFQHPERYIKYSVKELESMILDMFLFQDLAQTAAKASVTNLKQVLAQTKDKRQQQTTGALAADSKRNHGSTRKRGIDGRGTYNEQ